MRKLLLISVCFFACIISVSAQHERDSIFAEGNNYYHMGRQVFTSDLGRIMGDCPEAMKALRIANFYRNAGEIFLYTGTSLIGYAIWDLIMKNENEILLTAIGLGFVMGAIVCSVAYKSQVQSAVSIYNSNILSDAGSSFKLEFGSTKNGIGIICKF